MTREVNLGQLRIGEDRCLELHLFNQGMRLLYGSVACDDSVWLGLGDAAKVLVIWFAAFVPSVINSYAGVRSLERHVIEAARMLGASRSLTATRTS